jgi:hypothetical protein
MKATKILERQRAPEDITVAYITPKFKIRLSGQHSVAFGICSFIRGLAYIIPKQIQDP